MFSKDRKHPLLTTLAASACALTLGGCLESEGQGTNGFAEPRTPSGNAAPLISGLPGTDIAVGESYSFTPTATDSDGDKLTFSVDNKPDWADFDTGSGELSGQPTLGMAGDYRDIRISVSDGDARASLPRFSIRVAENSEPDNNSAPTITGQPPATATAEYVYSFVPQASDPDGDALSFSVQNLPQWAAFDSRTGELSGMPGMADVRSFSNILISVTDGEKSTSLRAFAINVREDGIYSTTLSWNPPTENEDGTQLMDLAGYKLYWGNTPGNYTKSVRIENPGISSYVVENLPAGTMEFVATSFNDDGIESEYSNPMRKVVN
jgi:hypothetical protein